MVRPLYSPEQFSLDIFAFGLMAFGFERLETAVGMDEVRENNVFPYWHREDNEQTLALFSTN